MAKKFIDVEKAVKEFAEMTVFEKDEFRELFDMIEPADVQEVVRCKDCVYYEKGKDYTPYCNHVNGLDHVNDDDYCSHGERKVYE